MGTILFMFWWWLLWLYAFASNAIAQPTYWSYSCEYFPAENEEIHHNIINSPSYQSNLSAVFSSLISHSTNGFYNTTTQVSYGQLNDSYEIAIYGESFCWGYASTSRCQSCIALASLHILHNCSYHDYAQIAYDDCMLRYWNDWGGLHFSNITIFRDITSESLDENECSYFDIYIRILIDEVPESYLTFKATEIQEIASVKRYVSVQCRDVEGCHLCLSTLKDQFSGICRGRRGRVWWIMSVPAWYEYGYPYFYNYSYTSDTECAMKFGDSPFYKLDQSSPPPLPGQRREVSHSNMSRTVLIGIIPSVIVVCLVGCCVNYLWRVNKRRKDHGPEAEGRSANFHHYVQNEDLLNVDIVTIPLRTILQCTCQFSDEFKLGGGGFGPVYKGILPDGRLIAVKLLSETSGQGLEEFKNEVTFITKLQHKNLVRLLGCCIEENKKLLVYEYMPNGSLDVHLFSEAKQCGLDWNIRLNIINGIARGLLYLYEDSQLRIIHRDLKASNILLDHNMNPKISDFGLARIFRGYQGHANTQRIVGTYGYIALEYAMDGLFSMKSDVFSFGILLLEIISGKRNSGNLLAHAWKLWCEDKSLMLMDSIIEKSCTPREVMKCIHIALLCVQEDAADRPTMSMVVLMLGSNEVILPTPNQPPFSVFQHSASDKSNNCSISHVTISNVAPR